ncbi:MAG: hypothetical protein QM648_05580 [Solirubrobacterales bacterium]
MKFVRSKLTYANVVSSLALFLALGGVSYAAVKLPANSVGEKQIKKNAVTGKKIKANAITGDKIKSGTIKGSDISLASLGQVPRAASAATSDQVVTFSKRVGASATGSGSQADVRASATPVELAGNSQVSVYGKCYLYGTTLYAELLERTTADGALSSLYSYNYYYGGSGYLDSTTAEGSRQIGYVSTSNNSAYYLSQYYGVGTLFGPDGNGLDFQIATWAKRGTVPTYGNGAYGSGDVCIFTGHAVKLSS